jgi:hypothetical protein
MRQYGVTPLMYQCGETVTVMCERRWHVSPSRHPLKLQLAARGLARRNSVVRAEPNSYMAVWYVGFLKK